MGAENIEDAMRETYEAPNFDLLLRACQTTSKALFPNFMFPGHAFQQEREMESGRSENGISTSWLRWDAAPVYLRMWQEKSHLWDAETFHSPH